MYEKDERKSKSNVDRYAERARRKLGAMNDHLGGIHPGAGDMPHGGDNGDHPMGSVREAIHRGKHIVVKTHYEITVDGEPLGAHLGVSDDGSVHYHGLPNYAFASMMDLVRKVIDASGVELPEDEIGMAGGES